MTNQPPKIELRPQKGAQELFLSTEADIAIYGGAAGGGKLVKRGDSVLTPFGFRKIESLSVGDAINNSDGSVGKLVQLKAWELLPRWTVKFHDGSSIDVTKTHLWQSWRSGKRKKIRGKGVFGPEASEVIETGTLADWLEIAQQQKQNGIRPNWPCTPVCEEQTFNVCRKHKIGIDPYLLGSFLGDGHISTLQLTSCDHDHVRNLLREYDFRESQKPNNKAIGFHIRNAPELRAGFERAGLTEKKSWSKFIPDEYKYGSIEDRYSVVQGLLDTDGCVESGRRVTYCTVSKQLADDFTEVVRSLGGLVMRREKTPTYTYNGEKKQGRLAYVLEINHRNPPKLFRLKRKYDLACKVPITPLYRRVVAVERSEELIEGRCITVSNPNGLYITNNYIVTHNSYALLLECLRYIQSVKNFGSTIFRRTSPQIRNEGGLWSESLKIYSGMAAMPLETTLKWRFAPYNNAVKFAHLDHDKDVLNYQGAQIPMIGFDELTHFSEYQFFYMMSRNRSTCGVRPYVRATTNPDCDSWVAKLIEWWIDQKTGYAIPERSGVVRWFARKGDSIMWADTKQELIDRFPDMLSEKAPPKSLTFIAATLDDNQILMEKDPGYKANLLALPTVERERLLGGNWKVKAAAGDYFPTHKVTIIDALPNNIVGYCRGWDLAATKPSEENKDPDATSGVKVGITDNDDLIIVDCIHDYLNPDEVEKLVKITAQLDGKQCQIRMPQDPGQAGKAQAKTYTKLLMGYPVTIEVVTGDKEVRSRPFSAQWRAGNVYLLKGAWNADYLDEMNGFPLAEHDDDVDASNDAYSQLVHGSNYTLRNL